MLAALQPGAQASADGGLAFVGSDAGPEARDQSSADPTWYQHGSGEAPRLIERRDGSYEYKGRGFDAVIEPNGNLRMRDRWVGDASGSSIDVHTRATPIVRKRLL